MYNLFLLLGSMSAGISLVFALAVPTSAYLFSRQFEARASLSDVNESQLLVAQSPEESSNKPKVRKESVDDKLGKRETAVEHAIKHSDPTYVCPMHPEVMSKKANEKCPICGMDLVLVEEGGDDSVVEISPRTMNALGVRTERVSKRNIYRKIDTVGYISANEKNIRAVNLRTEGWIEKLHVKSVGEYVRKGSILFEVYSPTLVNAQDEYVQALSLGNNTLINASQERLRFLGAPPSTIDHIRETMKTKELVPFFSPQDGVVAELMVREGMMVEPKEPILNLVDLSTVWLIADVFERYAGWIDVGQNAEAVLPFAPEKVLEGTVEYIYPSIDAKTRSLKVRLRFDNFDQALKPNMYADVRILAKPRKQVLAIPREAVIRTGTENRVIVALGDGKFTPMPIRVGVETDDHIEVISGLQEGDNVVVSSQFMIDSEASIKAAIMKMGR